MAVIHPANFSVLELTASKIITEDEGIHPMNLSRAKAREGIRPHACTHTRTAHACAMPKIM